MQEYPSAQNEKKSFNFEMGADLLAICCILNDCKDDFPNEKQGNLASRTIQFAQKLKKI